VKLLDPVTLAVLNGRLVQIADEMDATLYRSAFNPIIAEAHDACHGLYHAETGATLVQGTSGLPIFVGAMAFAVKAVIDKVREDGGPAVADTYLFNDPYDGGTHLNDVRLVRPLIRSGRVFAWLASVGHWLDVGGNVPGNFNAKATESFQEGFRISPQTRAHHSRTGVTSMGSSTRSISVNSVCTRCSTSMATKRSRPRLRQ
jgi:N-methylhydantoinase B